MLRPGPLDGRWMVPGYGTLTLERGAAVIGGMCPFTHCSKPMPIKRVPYRAHIDGDLLRLDLGDLPLVLGGGRNDSRRPS